MTFYRKAESYLYFSTSLNCHKDPLWRIELNFVSLIVLKNVNDLRNGYHILQSRSIVSSIILNTILFLLSILTLQNPDKFPVRGSGFPKQSYPLRSILFIKLFIFFSVFYLEVANLGSLTKHRRAKIFALLILYKFVLMHILFGFQICYTFF